MNNKLVCEECGGDNIETLYWVNPHTLEVGAIFTGERDDNWCNDCSDHVYFTTEEEYIKHNEEDEEDD